MYEINLFFDYLLYFIVKQQIIPAIITTVEKIKNMKDFDSIRKVSRGKFSYSKFLQIKEAAKNTVGCSDEYLSKLSRKEWYKFFGINIRNSN